MTTRNPRVLESLRKVEIFAGLADEELMMVAELCHAMRAPASKTIFSEGDEGSEIYIILDGCVRVMINTRRPDGEVTLSTINSLYSGQCFGEMTLLSSAPRSATISAAEPTTLLVMNEADFRALSDTHPRIGYCVVRNLAHDLAYKLRASNLLLRGNIRWQRGELGR